ncbi:MAG TPA: hypothetical protein VLS89_11405, partial [Candidatus Nanopelagicales bacterium]|nr:hypothetical protein [Candidatus Nanopelagicales bacterium]
PPHLVPFAHDGSGNYHCFDLRAPAPPPLPAPPARTRRAAPEPPELPITYWDHEAPDPGDPADLPDPTPFATWLEEQVDEALWTEVEQRRARLTQALAPHAAAATPPSLEEAQQAGEQLGLELPADYLWFTTTLGSVTAPIRIASALELSALTQAMRRAHPRAPTGFIAFAEESPGRFAAFAPDARIHHLGPLPEGRRPDPADITFTEYLERRLADPPRPAMPTPAAPPVQPPPEPPQAAAKSLLALLLERGAIEVEPTFDIDEVAAELAEARLSPRKLCAWLMDRDDVAEVFISDDELVALLKAF